MQKLMYYKILLLSLIFITACGPSINNSIKSEQTFSAIAIAPIKNSNNIREERVQIFFNLVEAKLKDKGYLILDRGIVNKICKNSDCENKQDLFKHYSINALIKINLDSNSETNIGLFSRYSVSAEAKLENANGDSIYSADSTSSKTGGLILESGQIIKAIKNLYINSADEIFLSLSAKLVEDLLDSLPTQSSNLNLTQFSTNIQNVTKTKLKDDFYKICLNGTPNSLASIINGREKTTLVETKNGTYCGSVFGIDKTIDLELRSPYGIQAKTQL